jgi:hypothetical protein
MILLHGKVTAVMSRRLKLKNILINNKVKTIKRVNRVCIQSGQPFLD